MTAEIVSVGTELLMGQIVDTDASHLASVLPEYGISCRFRQTVGDNLSRLTDALRLALSRADLVFTIGGLGPTEDDLTRDGIAAAFGQELVYDESIGERLRRLFAQRGFPWLETQLRQAMRTPDSEAIDNPNGTAPGLICRNGGKTVIALPGPKGEFVPMVEGPIRDYLSTLATGQVIVSKILKTCGIGESIVEERVRELIRCENPTVAPYAHPGEVTLRVTARAPTRLQAEEMIRPIEARIRELLEGAVYGTENDSLESVIIGLLCERREKLGVAESCTGGSLGGRITAVPGCSNSFWGGVISYDNSVKENLIGVTAETLAKFGAVSSECAIEMAEGIRKVLDVDWAISVTGIAGPDGGSAEKPVGLVYIGVAGPGGTSVEEHRFRGSREAIRQRAVQFALIQLRERLLSV